MKPGGTKQQQQQRGNRKEARLGESQQRKGGRGGRCERDKAVKKATEEDDGGEVGGVMDGTEWIRGVDVEDASTTETLSCTIHR